MGYLIVHLLISIVIGLLRFKKNRIEAWCYFTLCLFFPVGGYFISFFLIKKIRKLKTFEEEFEDDDRILLTDRMIGGNKDVVAIEDFLTFGADEEKRRNLIDVLKRDSSTYIDKLKLALRDEDTETAHYAASAISEYKRKLDLKLQHFALEMEKDSNDLYVMKSYFEVLSEYIHSSLLDKRSMKQYQKMMLDVLFKLVEMEVAYYKVLIQIYIDFEDYDQAEYYSEIFLEKEKSEDAYIMRLSVLFHLQDKRRFDEVFNKLRMSEVDLRSDAMSILRFWIKDVAYAEF